MKREASTSVVTLLGNVRQIPKTADAPLSGIWRTSIQLGRPSYYKRSPPVPTENPRELSLITH